MAWPGFRMGGGAHRPLSQTRKKVRLRILFFAHPRYLFGRITFPPPSPPPKYLEGFGQISRPALARIERGLAPRGNISQSTMDIENPSADFLRTSNEIQLAQK